MYRLILLLWVLLGLSACATFPAPEVLSDEPSVGLTDAAEPEDGRSADDGPQVGLDPPIVATEDSLAANAAAGQDAPVPKADEPTELEDASDTEDVFSDTEDVFSESEDFASDTQDEAPVDGGSADLWTRVRQNFSLPEIEHKRITSQLDWYRRHPAYMQRVAVRATPYLYYIVDSLEENDIPMELALLPIVESAFQPFAYSHGRAAGIWQFIPATGKRFGLKQNWWYDGRRDVYASTQAAIDLLQTLHRQFHGDWLLALAAYNSGPGTVRRAIRRNKRKGKPTDFWSLQLPRETRAYVPKLLALSQLIKDPAAYGLALPRIPDEVYFAQVKLASQIDLAKAAELAGIEVDELYRLNPGYNRWATAPDGPHRLLIPINTVDAFSEGLKALPPESRIHWIRHRIRSGETLSTIAMRYNTSMGTIKRVNHIRGTHLRAGHSLTIPVASKSAAHYRLSATQRKKSLQNLPRKGVKVIHIVRRGDTFWGLARRHKVNVRALAKWNGMTPRDTLMPGQRLVIWSRASTGGTASLTPLHEVPTPLQRNITRRIGYRVRSGDSLALISRKFRVSIPQLRRWNHLPKGKYLQPGQRLTLYIDVTQQSG